MRIAVPTVWEVISILIGAIGLGLWVLPTVNVSLSELQLYAIGYLVSIPLIYISINGIRSYLERTRYLIQYYGVDQKLTFSIERICDNKIVPKGHSSRITHIRTGDRNYSRYVRRHLVTDRTSTSVRDVLDSCKHYAEFLLPRRDGIETKKMEVIPRFSEFRELRLEMKLPDEFFPMHRKFYIKEEMDLPNDFTDNTEFYNLSIEDPVEKRKIKLEFLDIPVSEVRYKVYKGTRKTKIIPLQIRCEEFNGTKKWVAEETWKNPEIGTIIRIEWDWDLSA